MDKTRLFKKALLVVGIVVALYVAVVAVTLVVSTVYMAYQQQQYEELMSEP